MNYTSVEQSKKLFELGLNPESADMHWWIDDGNKAVFVGYNTESAKNYADTEMDYIPCWSVGALLEVMPKAIQKYDEREKCYKTYHPNLYQAYYHCCGYAFGPSLNQENYDMLCSFADDNWINVIYKQVIWLLENNYIKQ